MDIEIHKRYRANHAIVIGLSDRGKIWIQGNFGSHEAFIHLDVVEELAADLKKAFDFDVEVK